MTAMLMVTAMLEWKLVVPSAVWSYLVWAHRFLRRLHFLDILPFLHLVHGNHSGSYGYERQISLSFIEDEQRTRPG